VHDFSLFSLAAGQMPPPANVSIQRFDPIADTAVSGEATEQRNRKERGSSLSTCANIGAL
jgi:hypothetical protein